MKIKNLLLWFWIFLIIYITLYTLHINNQKQNNIEGFTPKIRGLYRPHIRNLRILTETFMGKYSSDYFTKILRNIGIY